MGEVAGNRGAKSASWSWVRAAFWSVLPNRSSANAGQRSMRGQLCSKVIPRETGANSKRVCFWKLHNIVTLGLVLSIGSTLSWLALWAGYVAGDKLNTSGSVKRKDFLKCFWTKNSALRAGNFEAMQNIFLGFILGQRLDSATDGNSMPQGLVCFQ